MTALVVTSASVGTKLATVADTKIVGLTVATPSSMADALTPLALVDAATAPTGPVHALYSADLTALVGAIFGYKAGTGSVSAPPGVTAPTSPFNLGLSATASIPFTSGVWVKSCPTGVTFNVTTG